MSDKPETRLMNIKDPMGIERSSLGIIDSEVPEPRPYAGNEWLVVRRMIHTTADFELLDLIRFQEDAIDAGLAALTAGCRIVTDTEMARCGIPLRRMTPLGCSVVCYMNTPSVIERAKAEGTTRARAAVDLAVEEYPESIFVIGNAPTALLRLVDHIEAGTARPGLVVGMPVGFVNAAESKDILMRLENTPWIAIEGRKGGSALAACVINALAEIVNPS